MSLEQLAYLPEGTRVTFELRGALPILREEYHSPQAGTIVLKGFFNQTAHLELLDGSRYCTRSARRDNRYLSEIYFPVLHLPDKTEAFGLRTPIKAGSATQRVRFTTLLGEEVYVFKQVSPGKRGFELWESMEVQKLVERARTAAKLIPDLVVLAPVPAILTLLVPWLDNQTYIYQRR
jgi:hypothetical protein